MGVPKIFETTQSRMHYYKNAGKCPIMKIEGSLFHNLL